MKLISRKGLTAVVAAAAISTASLTAPAMAEPAPAESSMEQTNNKEDNKGNDNKGDDTKTPAVGSSENLDGLKNVVTFLLTIGSAFGAITSLMNNVQNFFKNIFPR